MNSLSAADLLEIIQRRDPRYDGRFFFGVTTTRIYCRPICPARPKPENIRLFKSATEAERAGFRPCLRCHPDAAPGTTRYDGTGNTVVRALRIIDESNDDLDMVTLANTLGMTDRHLRRLFDSHLGASPLEILTSKRLHLVRQLLLRTRTPITEIAHTAGFRSIRRFNEAFRSLYQTTPSAMRKSAMHKSVVHKSVNEVDTDGLHLTLTVRAPYDWTHVMTFLGRHETHGVERVNGDCYQRFVPTDNGYASLTLGYNRKRSSLEVTARDLPLTRLKQSLSALRHLFDCDHNPAHLPASPLPAPDGVRLPGAFDGFETAVTIILGQLVSTRQAKQKTRDLVLRYGRKIGEDPGGEIFAFPKPADLIDQELEAIGMTRARADAIRGLAQAVNTGEIELSPTADLIATREKLLALRGIGPWTTEMIAMRVLGDPDAFPKSDLIIARALQQNSIDSSTWSTMRAYLSHCLWRDYATPSSSPEVKS